MIRVLLAVSPAEFASEVENLLEVEGNFTVIGCITDLGAIPDSIRALPPDLLILKDCLPPPPVCDSIHKLRLMWPNFKVALILSEQTNLSIAECFRSGIHSFLLEHELPIYLLHAGQAAVNGGCWFSPGIHQKLMITVETAIRSTGKRDFTVKEIAILRLSVQGKKETVIAKELEVSERTVRHLWENILIKLHVNTRIEAVAWAVKLGLIEMEERE